MSPKEIRVFSRLIIIFVICTILIFCGLSKVEYSSRWNMKNQNLNDLKKIAYNISDSKDVTILNSANLKGYDFVVDEQGRININLYKTNTKYISVVYTDNYEIKSIKVHSRTFSDIVLIAIISVLLGMIANVPIYLIYIIVHSIYINVRK